MEDLYKDHLLGHEKRRQKQEQVVRPAQQEKKERGKEVKEDAKKAPKTEKDD